MPPVAFEFSEKEHRYTGDGAVIPSVTQSLTLAGVDDVSMIPIRNLEHARQIGSVVHLACEYLDRDDLDLESLDSEIVGYMVGYQKFREEYQFKPELIEHRMIGEVDGLRYGMCLDRIGTVAIKGIEERVLFDIKTASRPQASWPIQTAAYMLGYSAVDTEARPGRAVVHLSKDGKYRVLRHTMESDFDIWRATLMVAHWKLANGSKLK